MSREARARLEGVLLELDPIAVAFSGGVDSSLLLAVSRRLLGDGAVAAIGVSASLGQAELQIAREVSAQIEVELLEIPTDELSIPGYVENSGNRCFHCKSELYQHLGTHPRLQGRTICDGTHAEDDRGDRPGMRAAVKRGVRSPLADAGLGKQQIRDWALELGLSNWDRPARPCLASRVKVGTTVNVERLAAVESLEAVLADAGFRVYRARLDADQVIVELGREELYRLEEPAWRERFVSRARSVGRADVWLNLCGYGSSEPARLTRLGG